MPRQIAGALAPCCTAGAAQLMWRLLARRVAPPPNVGVFRGLRVLGGWGSPGLGAAATGSCAGARAMGCCGPSLAVAAAGSPSPWAGLGKSTLVTGRGSAPCGPDGERGGS